MKPVVRRVAATTGYVVESLAGFPADVFLLASCMSLS
jgi:hypothetical protein